MASLFVEGTELDEAVAHDVRIGGQSRAYLIHSILRHLIPILTMAVDDLQLAAVLMADSCRHLQILLRRAVPLLFLFWTNLDIETVGLQTLTNQFVEHDAGVDTA